MRHSILGHMNTGTMYSSQMSRYEDGSNMNRTFAAHLFRESLAGWRVKHWKLMCFKWGSVVSFRSLCQTYVFDWDSKVKEGWENVENESHDRRPKVKLNKWQNLCNFWVVVERESGENGSHDRHLNSILTNDKPCAVYERRWTVVDHWWTHCRGCYHPWECSSHHHRASWLQKALCIDLTSYKLEEMHWKTIEHLPTALVCRIAILFCLQY